MKIIEERKIIFIILFILFLLTPFFFAYFLLRQPPQPIKSRAQESVDFCKDKCIGFDRCSQSSSSVPGDPNYNDPCCEEIKKTGDPGACPWPQRGYCTDAQCASIPPDVNRQRCGGPRNVWCNLCRDNKCPGYGGSSPPSQPTPPPKPTSPPPTNTPIPPPTGRPTYTPTIKPLPTAGQIFKPIEFPTPQTRETIPTTSYYSQPFSLPKLKLPEFKIDSRLRGSDIYRQSAKVPGSFEYLFRRITYYDKLLENTINSQLQNLLNKFK